jgi:hypothetical protein
LILESRFSSGIDGKEALRRIVPIVFSTVSGAPTASEMLRLGARGFVSKAAGADEPRLR